ncbi:MAG: ATP-binding protein [Robiginitomaculum sp.]|nr:MAG: ATP-binding protein [Robiginitomaculum sp.]
MQGVAKQPEGDNTDQGRSLVWRLVRSAAMWVVPALLFTAFSLILFYRASTYKNFNDPLINTIQALVANIEYDPLNANEEVGIILANQPIDARYQLALSGRYWMVGELRKDGMLVPIISSLSLSNSTLKLSQKEADKVREKKGEIIRAFSIGPDNEPLSLAAQCVIFNDRNFVIAAAADRRPAAQAIRQFSVIALGLLSVLALGLTLAIYMQVRSGLRPLFELRDSVVDVREGRAGSVEGSYPKEIKPLADELNSLIGHNRDVVEYARAHVSNLAHALKTPLAVLMNEADGKRSKLARIVKKQTGTMNKQVDHHLFRARAATRGQSIGEKTPVSDTVNSLVRTLGRIFRDKDLDFQVDIESGLHFRGEKRDLEEMVGNLLDNACKWTKAEIHVMVEVDPESDAKIRITIDDDGLGMAADQYENVLKRGTRLDETTPGTGFGLSIVNDLAIAYKGVLILDKSPLGGLRTILIIPMVRE